MIRSRAAAVRRLTPERSGLGGEDAHHPASTLQFFVEPLEWVRRPHLGSVSFAGKRLWCLPLMGSAERPLAGDSDAAPL